MGQKQEVPGDYLSAQEAVRAMSVALSGTRAAAVSWY